MAVTIDIANAKDGFTVYDEGDYEATVSKAWEIVPSKSTKGNYNANLELTMKEGGGTYFQGYSLSPNALWRLKTELAEFGVEYPSEPLALQEFQEWLNEVVPVGTEVVLHLVVEDDWQNRKDPKTGETLKQNRATMSPVNGSAGGAGW
jgi:hypothetical protein